MNRIVSSRFAYWYRAVGRSMGYEKTVSIPFLWFVEYAWYPMLRLMQSRLTQKFSWLTRPIVMIVFAIYVFGAFVYASTPISLDGEPNVWRFFLVGGVLTSVFTVSYMMDTYEQTEGHSLWYTEQLINIVGAPIVVMLTMVTLVIKLIGYSISVLSDQLVTTEPLRIMLEAVIEWLSDVLTTFNEVVEKVTDWFLYAKCFGNPWLRPWTLSLLVVYFGATFPGSWQPSPEFTEWFLLLTLCAWVISCMMLWSGYKMYEFIPVWDGLKRWWGWNAPIVYVEDCQSD